MCFLVQTFRIRGLIEIRLPIIITDRGTYKLIPEQIEIRNTRAGTKKTIFVLLKNVIVVTIGSRFTPFTSLLERFFLLHSSRGPTV